MTLMALLGVCIQSAYANREFSYYYSILNKTINNNTFQPLLTVSVASALSINAQRCESPRHQ